jgi:spermidine synthase
MIPWKLIDSSIIPGDGGEIRLYQRGTEFSIRVGNYELMNNRIYGSEDALASMTCQRLPHPERARVLIGGLGMGFTLARVLQNVGALSEVVQAELVPAVVRWNRGPLAPFAGNPLADPRVTVREEDVGRVIRSERNAYDAILLDVDNGPTSLTSKTNDWLYGMSGLRAASAALKPEGILAVWSAGPDDKFTKRLHQAGFTSEQVRVRSRGEAGGARYLIWLAHKERSRK